MSKKVKRGGNTEMYSSYTIGGGDDKTRFKYEILLQDFHDLLKETEAKKRELKKINQKKLRLYDEVRFLRKRYKKLMKNPSRQNQCVLIKKQTLLNESNSRINPSETPSTSIDASLDLNQSSLQNVEATEYYSEDGNYENRYEEEEETKLVCRDVGGTGTSSRRTGKRKISWQDQYALKV
ncbi:hypothetical protein FCM35_KLT16593 [Carex littledalei]|uniref:Uncharacterized protein n=1 Tax=Carex littledalei TaxID=544730 RepID=A0A833RD48_9POAL|nr:hypothetical protein FCM35_KLT16593 [Carex littledalei]